MSNDSQRDPSSLASMGGIAPHDAPLTFEPRSDLTYRLIEGAKISNVSVHRSLLTGSILRGCTFTSVDFTRCDMDGMLIEDCTFIDCDISFADVRSCAFSRCVLRRCQFVNAFVSDCSFASTRFDNSSLQGAIVVDCSFVESFLWSTIFARGSFTQNRFRRSHFREMVLGDCTFLYNVVSHCTFEDSAINAEAVGMTFGLSRDDMKRMRLVYLGEDETLPPDVDPVPPLIEAYSKRRWRLGVAIMCINFGIRSTAFAIREYLQALRESAAAGVVIKRDELVFFATVLEQLESEEALPLMSCVDVIETLSRIAADIESSSRPDSAHTSSTLHLISSKIILIMDSMIERFEAERLQIESTTADEPVSITFVLKDEPGTPVAALLTQVSAASGLPILHGSQTIDIRIGSYEEYVLTTLFSAFALQMFLYLLNGCVVQITELKVRLGLLAKRRPPAAYMRNALQPRQSPPEFLLAPMRKLLTHAAAMKSFPDSSHDGFSKSNIILAQRGRPVRKNQPPRSEEK